MRRVGTLGTGATVGASLAYLLDPANGRRRQKVGLDRLAGALRSTGRRLGRALRLLKAEGYGVRKQIEHRHEMAKELDDATLAHKIETVIFGDPDVPKGQINVNVQKGVAQLRGEVPNPNMLEDLVEKTREVRGVREVESLLHLPDTPTPMHE
jgi:osmotically-inducible protein OsmY